jgi:hypothetical protein
LQAQLYNKQPSVSVIDKGMIEYESTHEAPQLQELEPQEALDSDLGTSKVLMNDEHRQSTSLIMINLRRTEIISIIVI